MCKKFSPRRSIILFKRRQENLQYRASSYLEVQDVLRIRNTQPIAGDKSASRNRSTNNSHEDGRLVHWILRSHQDASLPHQCLGESPGSSSSRKPPAHLRPQESEGGSSRSWDPATLERILKDSYNKVTSMFIHLRDLNKMRREMEDIK